MSRGKLRFAAALALIALVFAAIAVIAVLKFKDYVSELKLAPYNYPDSDWVCDEPYIKYHIPEDISKAADVASVTVGGEEVRFVIEQKSGVATAKKYITDSDGRYDSKNAEPLFSGEISYLRDSFTVEIDPASDKLFDGRYKELVFKKIEK